MIVVVRSQRERCVAWQAAIECGSSSIQFQALKLPRGISLQAGVLCCTIASSTHKARDGPPHPPFLSSLPTRCAPHSHSSSRDARRAIDRGVDSAPSHNLANSPITMAGSKSAAHSHRVASVIARLPVRSPSPTLPVLCSRLLKEYREVLKHQQHKLSSVDRSLDPILLSPVDESNLYRWTASILGPPDTPFAHHRFTLSLSIPSSYPHSPPSVTFSTPIAHPNIHPRTGEICEWHPRTQRRAVPTAHIGSSIPPRSPVLCCAQAWTSSRTRGRPSGRWRARAGPCRR